MTDKSFIYIIGEDKDGSPIKIGLSKDPRGRLAGLQTANPNKLVIHKLYEVPSIRVKTIERNIHVKLQPVRLSGEWVDLSISHADMIVSYIIEKYSSFANVSSIKDIESKKSENNRKAVAAFSKRKKEKGYRVLKCWIDPETSSMLEELKELYGGIDTILSDAVSLLHATVKESN